jgi:replicative DNA helicase
MPDNGNIDTNVGHAPGEHALNSPGTVRIPPHSDEAEQSVIGSVMLDEEAAVWAAEHLKADDFYNARNRIIFDAVLNLHWKNQSIDLVTVLSELEKEGKLEEAGGSQYLTGISVRVPTSVHIKEYVQTVRERSLYRRFIHLANNILNDSYSTSTSIEDLSDKVEKEVFGILQNRGSEDFADLNALLVQAFDQIEAVCKNGGTIAGIPTGYPDLDAKLAGLHPSDLILIGARPAMGKSAFGLNIVENAALHSGKSCAVFSLEMSGSQVANRLLASQARVDMEHMRSGTMTDDDWTKIVEALDPLSKSKIYIDDTPGITVSEMRSKCRKLQLEKGLDLVMVDYLQLMSGSGRSQDNRQQEISEISRGLKLMARELNIPVIALSQLSRGVEARSDKRPMMSDLRESGAIEQDADVVMFIYRDEYYNEDTEDRNVAEIIIGKQRNGPTGTVKLRYDGMYTRFSSLVGGQGYTNPTD